MERLILDTKVLISAERDGEALERLIADDDDVELAGAKRRAERAASVDTILGTVVVEDYTLATAQAHARLLAHVKRSGTPRGAHDLVIAATAVATGRQLVTTDARGFDRLPDVQIRR